jgi:hypothetical protein
MTFKRARAFVTIILSASLLAACNTGGTSGYSKRIHMLAAPSGQLVTTSNNGQATGTLTLNNTHPSALWYADRPDREAGEVALKSFLGPSWYNAYKQLPPNATLQFVPAGKSNVQGVYLSLSNPGYDETSGTVTFNVRVLDNTLDGPLPSTLTFTNATLNILNNAEDEVEVSSYVQYAANASFEATTTANERELVMTQAGPDMFWVDNAPGTYSASRPMSEFFLQWSYVFGDTPPNAALVGTTATGQYRVYFVTISDPHYDETTHELRYRTKLLGANFGATEPLEQAVLLIDSGQFTRFPLPGKGTGYQAFGQGYDPSTANTTYIYFGSDIARKQTGSLWGNQSYLSESCGAACRDDLRTMKAMGINLIRLYDWDPRNDHSQFLDYAESLDMKVVVPISNWLPTQGANIWAEQLPTYFNSKNFGNRTGTNWHNAIAGVIISNELDQEYGGNYYSNVIGLVAAFLKEADNRSFSKSVLVGAPVTFASTPPQNVPSWTAFDKLVNDTRLANYKNRLMLCPNTYNDRSYLFGDGTSSGNGWVQKTYSRYKLPILFTEIGSTRTGNPTSKDTVKDQLLGSIEYQKANPDQLLGAMHFQFDNKVWKQTPGDTDSEGAFGAFSHGSIVKQIQTTQGDYDIYINEAGTNYGTLTIDKLDKTTTYDAVVEAYQ